MPDDSKEKRIVQNLTAKRLTITGDDGGILVLAPFEKDCKLSPNELKLFPLLESGRLEMRNVVRVLSEKDPGNFEEKLKMLFWGLGVPVGVLIYILNLSFKDDPLLIRWVWIGGLSLFVIGLLIGAFLLWKARKTGPQELSQLVMRSIAQSFSLLLVFAVGIGLPTVAVYFFGGGREFLGGQASLALFGRALQLLFIATASFLPALLYFLFDRRQLGTLRERFQQQIFRLDPNIETLIDVRAKYGRQIEEIYGPESTGGQGRLIRGTRWPIFVATLVITLGWILTLLPAEASVVITQPSEVFNFFLPQRTAVTFGFLGAYFFALNTVLRRYVRADLQPKAYSSITVRIFVVVILAWVVGLLPFIKNGGPDELVVAFIIGIFPESGLTLIRESIRKRTGLGRLIPYTKEKHPLTDLEDIDVYDRARLLDEGVTNIESLAHHDLIDLMLETRIPVPRLVDWIDQAILYLHLAFDDGQKATPDNTADGNNGEGKPRVITVAGPCGALTFGRLRTCGIRTATDFMKAYDKGKGPLLKIMSSEEQTLEVLFKVLEDDEWLSNICHWRDSAGVEPDTIDASYTTKEQGSTAKDPGDPEGQTITAVSSVPDSSNVEEDSS